MCVRVKFKAVREGVTLPQKAHHEDACYDVKVLHVEMKTPTLCVCYLGFETEIPVGWKGVIVPRSGQTKTKWAMLNSPGQIDSIYRGEWQVRFTYIGQDDFIKSDFIPPFEIGDRVAQIYFERVEEADMVFVEELSSTDRGGGGFGHTGK